MTRRLLFTIGAGPHAVVTHARPFSELDPKDCGSLALCCAIGILKSATTFYAGRALRDPHELVRSLVRLTVGATMGSMADEPSFTETVVANARALGYSGQISDAPAPDELQRLARELEVPVAELIKPA